VLPGSGAIFHRGDCRNRDLRIGEVLDKIDDFLARICIRRVPMAATRAFARPVATGGCI
jgi:hypothetical protein